MSQVTSILTESIRRAALERLQQLDTDVDAHIAAGWDAHDNHQLLNTPYLDGSGNTVAPRTLRVGVLRLADNTKIVVDIPIVT